MNRPFRQDARGAAAVEFALIAPLLIATIFGVIEGARYIWTRQALQQAAFVGARCLSLGITANCANAAAARARAVSEARQIGIPVQPSYVTAEGPRTCGTGTSAVSGMSRVAITMPFRSAASGFLPYRFTQIAVDACFPAKPSS
jgi:Flp pilus assembly protein TadG